MEGNGKPVTRAELDEALGKLKTELKTEIRDELIEQMRQIETSLLSAFHGYARGTASQTKSLTATVHSHDERMAALEGRVLEIEARLGGVTPPRKDPSS